MTRDAFRREDLVQMVVPRPNAVIFDLDGTLLHTLSDIALALRIALETRGFSAPSEAEIASMVGDGARMLCSRAVSRAPDDPVVSAVLSAFVAAYADNPTPHTRLADGADALLDALSSRGIPAAVATNKPGPVARVIVERMFGARIALTLGGGDTDHLKPHAEPLLTAVRTLGVSLPVWMVGDAEPDVLAAHAAGAFSIGLRVGYGRPASGALLTIDRLDELIAFL